MKIFISTSTGKSKKSPRSLFLSSLMKAFGGQFGTPAADAFARQDAEALKKVFAEAADSLIQAWPSK